MIWNRPKGNGRHYSEVLRSCPHPLPPPPLKEQHKESSIKWFQGLHTPSTWRQRLPNDWHVDWGLCSSCYTRRSLRLSTSVMEDPRRNGFVHLSNEDDVKSIREGGKKWVCTFAQFKNQKHFTTWSESARNLSGETISVLRCPEEGQAGDLDLHINAWRYPEQRSTVLRAVRFCAGRGIQDFWPINLRWGEGGGD